MSYRFKLTNGNAILNFSEEYYHTPIQLIESEGFRMVLKAFVEDGKTSENDVYLYLHACNQDDGLLVKDLRNIARLLLIMKVEEEKKACFGFLFTS